MHKNMQWNVKIGVGNLYTELFVTDIFIIPHVLYEEIVKLLTLTERFCHEVSSFDKDRSHVHWEHTDSFK